MTAADPPGQRIETRLAHLGRPRPDPWAAVNHAPFRGSTILFDSAAALAAARAGGREAMRYGLVGNPTVFALEAALSDLEGAEGTVLYPSGLAAIAGSLLAVLESGDHLLMSDAVYGPARRLAEGLLARLGIATTWFPAAAGGALEDFATPRTRAIYVETPGTNTFDLVDLPAVAAFARARGLAVIVDNTWASGLALRPLDLGADITLMATTKYVGGHSDLLMGSAGARGAMLDRLRDTALALGQTAGSEEVFLALRGLRTLAMRLARSGATGLALADWLSARPEVAQVLHPARPDFPGHALWRRDFTGCAGLFAVVLRPDLAPAVPAFLDALALFGRGGSWGGYESLVLPQPPGPRAHPPGWLAPGPILRIHAGLEDPGDLVADLAAAFAALAAAA